MMSEPLLSFDAEDMRGRAPYDGAIVIAIVAVIAGIAFPFLTHSSLGVPISGLLIIGGIAIYLWAPRAAPNVVYYRYLWIDGDGIHLVEWPDASEQLFTWRNIKSARSFFDEETMGIELELRAPSGWAQHRRIHVQYRPQLDHALSLIESKLRAHDDIAINRA